MVSGLAPRNVKIDTDRYDLQGWEDGKLVEHTVRRQSIGRRITGIPLDFALFMTPEDIIAMVA